MLSTILSIWTLRSYGSYEERTFDSCVKDYSANQISNLANDKATIILTEDFLLA